MNLAHSSTRPSVSLAGLFEALTALLMAATVASGAARWWWLCELLTHFKPHLGVVLLVLGLGWWWRGPRRWAVASLVGALVNLLPLLLFLLSGTRRAPAEGPGLKVLVLNVHTANQHHQAVLDLIRAETPEVVLLMEVNRRWLDALAPLSADYPHRLTEGREDNFGIALLSRLPLTNGVVAELGDAQVPSVTATVTFQGRSVHLVGTHPLPPGSAEYARLRNEQLRALAADLRSRTGPVVLLGDLNCTPWSPFFHDLLRDSGLRDPAAGRWPPGTWPAWLPFGRIALDRCLVSPGVTVVRQRLGPQVGGDHLPLLVELKVP